MAKIASKLFRYGYGALDDLGFFSPTTKVLDMMQQKKGTPEQMFSQMKQIGNKPVIDEMMFTGIEDEFITQPKVTSDQLKDYLSKNKTEINKIVKSKANMEEQNQVLKKSGINLRSNAIITNLNDGDDVTFRGLQNNVYDEIDTSFVTDDGNRIDFTVKPINYDDLDPDNLEYMGTANNVRPELFKFSFKSNGKDYDIQGSKDYGYEVYEDGMLWEDGVGASLLPSLNEAQLTVNHLMRITDDIPQEKFDLTPRHEDYTMPGGENYQEIVLQLGKHMDPQATNMGKLQDTSEYLTYKFSKDRRKKQTPNLDAEEFEKNSNKVLERRAQFKSIGKGNNEVMFAPDDIKALKAGEIVEFTDSYSRGGAKIGGKYKMDLKTEEVYVLKPDYKVSEHWSEPNVLTWLRTKDRVDEDGRKILYVEEIQSDLSQRGRGNFIMGKNEKKAFINKNNPKIFGDILDNIQDLQKTTNIDEYKGVYGTQFPKATSNNLDPDNKVFIGHKDRDFTLDNYGVPNRKKDSFDVADIRLSDETQNAGGKYFVDLNTKGYSFEDLVKKQMTKYKFLPLKDQKLTRATNQGLSKQNLQEYRDITNPEKIREYIDNDVYVYAPEKRVQIEENVGGLDNELFDVADDNVGMQYLKEQTERLKSNVFLEIVKDKVLAKNLNHPELKFIQRLIKEEKTTDDINKKIVNNGQIMNLLEDAIFNTRLFKNIDEKLFSFEEKEELRNLWLSKEQINKSEEDILKQLEFDDYEKRNLKRTSTEEERLKRVKNAQYEQDLISYFPTNFVYRDGQTGATTRILKENLRFDYDPKNKMQVYKQLKDLDNNLNEAVKYQVKLDPTTRNYPSAPFVGTTPRFTELAIKNALIHASKNGYDGVAFSTGKIHSKRWKTPSLTKYYDKDIPDVANKILKDTGGKLEYKTIFTDKDFLQKFKNDDLDYDTFFPDDYDLNSMLDELDDIDLGIEGGYIKETPTIYLTNPVNEYIESGVSLYSPIVATGIAGTIANQILGSEEDIVENEGI